MAGLYNPVRPTSAAFGDIGVVVIITIANGSLLFVLIRRLTEVALKASENEKAQIEANRELLGLKDNLEIRINERTSALEEVNAINVRRAKQFEAISQIARATTSIQNLEILLRDITKLISGQFGFYHVGIFLMDDSREFAVLMAANSTGGKKMLARNHKLKVGQVGIVGYVTSSGNPRIALDVGTDAVHFDNPDLPDTRSELALPLQIGKQIIGALDVQSLESNAFSQDDVQILSTLADQIAIAIQNARSFEESRKLLHEAQSTLSSYMTESWQALRPIQKGLGYQFSGNSIKVLESPIEGAHIKDALKKGVVIISGENSNNLAIPIRLRGQVIGVMNLQNPAGQAWNQDQIDIAAATAERLSLAIENATLLQATQRRADIERVTTNISTQISSSTHFETILKTAAEELSRAFGGSDVLVQIEPVAMKLGINKE
jgi:GAF domain-containing protein